MTFPGSTSAAVKSTKGYQFQGQNMDTPSFINQGLVHKYNCLVLQMSLSVELLVKTGSAW